MFKRKFNTFYVFLVLTILNCILVHFVGLTFMIATIAFFLIAAIAICFDNHLLNPVLKSGTLYVLLFIQDIATKLFGGSVDAIGHGIINMLFLICAALVFIVVLIMACMEKRCLPAERIAATILFPCLIILHFILFENVGLGQ